MHRVGRVDRRCFHERLAVVARRHRRDVADPHPTSRVRCGVVEQLGEMVADQVVERQPTLADLQRQCRARERLAQRVHEAAAVAGVGRPVALDDPVAVPLDDQPVRVDPGITFDGVEKRSDPLGSDPLRRRAADVHIALCPTRPQATEPSFGAGSFGARSSGAGPTGRTDRIVTADRPARPASSVPPGAFLRETVDAHLTRAALGPARQSHPVAFRLSTKHLAGIITSRHDRSGGVGWLRLQLRPSSNLPFGLLQAPCLTKWRADLALAQLADPPSCMRDRLLLFRRHRLIRISRKLLTHRATEYRRRRVEPHHRHDRRVRRRPQSWAASRCCFDSNSASVRIPSRCSAVTACSSASTSMPRGYEDVSGWWTASSIGTSE